MKNCLWDNIEKLFISEILVKMRIGGTSISQVELSYRESLAVSIIHGQGPLNALFRYYYELIKHNFIIFPLIKCGYSGTRKLDKMLK